jgi:hypothetical protein
VQRREHGEHQAERGGVGNEQRRHAAPNTASSINSRTGSSVGRDASGDMDVPQTTATSTGAFC